MSFLRNYFLLFQDAMATTDAMGPISQTSECDKDVKILNKISSIKIKYVLTDTDNRE
jgi:hypothetical protein